MNKPTPAAAVTKVSTDQAVSGDANPPASGYRCVEGPRLVHSSPGEAASYFAEKARKAALSAQPTPQAPAVTMKARVSPSSA